MVIFVSIMDIGYSYRIVQFIANKNNGAYISPQEFQDTFNLAQKQYQDELIEVLQGWNSNRGSKIIPANIQQVKQKLAPFIAVASAAAGGNGQLGKPGNVEQLMSMRTQDNLKRIWRVEEDRLATHLDSDIDPVEDNPIYVERGSYYQIYPVNIGTVNYDYIITAPDVVYGYTTVSGRPVYNAGTSTQPLWGDLDMTYILIRVLFMFGISIQAQNLTQYYGEVKNNGQ